MEGHLVTRVLEKIGTGFRLASLEYSPGSAQGDGNASQLVRVKIVLESDEGTTQTKSLILKKQPESKAVREFLEELSVFKTEIDVYTSVLPQMEKLMEEFSDDCGPLWCKCLGHDADKVLVLEDLKEQGFVLTDRHSGMDKERALLAAKGLGRFHGMSPVLIRQGKVDTVKFTNYPYFQNKISLKNYFKGAIDTLLYAIRNRWDIKWAPIADRIEEYLRDFGSKLKELGRLQSGTLNVLNHGDCWVSNMMFKYPSGAKEPQEIRFLDFQVCHYNSYAWDLVNLLHTSILPEVRRELYTELVAVYRTSLVDTFRAYGLPVEDVPSEDDVTKEMGKLDFFSFLLCCSHMPATLSPPGDGLQMEALMDEGSEKGTAPQNINMYMNEIYVRAIQADIENCMNKGLF